MPDISAQQCLALLALGTGLTACFDVQQVDVPSDTAQTGLLIDDFESGDSRPANPKFLPWFCISTKGCGVWSPGDESDHAYFTQFELLDPKNGKIDYPPGGQLGTWRSSEERLDSSPYKTLRFSAMPVPGELGLPSPTLTVRLYCPGQGDATDAIASITLPVPVGSGWQPYTLPLSAFTQQGWQLASEPEIDPHLCRKQIDGFGFEVQDLTLLDGQSASGTLLIDDVRLR